MMTGGKPVMGRLSACSGWLSAAMALGVIAASLGAFSGIAFATTTGPYQRASQPTATYVALGDSFASGDGIKAQGWVNHSGVADRSSVANDGCDRSSEGYPELVGKWLQGQSLLGPMTFSFLACSGATTTDVWSGSPSRHDGLIGRRVTTAKESSLATRNWRTLAS
jgi:hypothetical protein